MGSRTANKVMVVNKVVRTFLYSGTIKAFLADASIDLRTSFCIEKLRNGPVIISWSF